MTSVHDLVFLPQVREPLNDLERQIIHISRVEVLII